MTLPDCMMPDGNNGACRAYQELTAERDRLQEICRIAGVGDHKANRTIEGLTETGVLREENARYRQALERIIEHGQTPLDGSLHKVNPVPYTIAREALAEPEEFEEVEVVRWMCPKCSEVYESKQLYANKCSCIAPLTYTDCIKLTGTIQRPAKKKVLRRVEAEKFMCAENVHHYFGAAGLETSVERKRLFLEWYD